MVSKTSQLAVVKKAWNRQVSEQRLLPVAGAGVEVGDLRRTTSRPGTRSLFFGS
jgi:hypothetical protein